MSNAIMPHNLFVGILLVGVLVGGCGGHEHQQKGKILAPPPNADPAAVSVLLKGTGFFPNASGQQPGKSTKPLSVPSQL